ncbi:Cleavage and polyadenylation specificity factor subunit 5 [Babesia sp. Xinjiang]|uniref:Cleavage and polyadenylation specificity factor subunit 5 n=1 Tax=Babesia sp. Xinjiang TaxID=462227 RepID=UPI000A25032F|nr:Cleavage and polyadenylation specificity factor subunit 5 [Babesia sp. Xinjiang]ORM40020.1 Cleavage and polyadenylation specificity factor subunit 5 [Babesia sp. Xinjiang]
MERCRTMKCGVLPLFLLCAVVRRWHTIDATFSLFEDPKDSYSSTVGGQTNVDDASSPTNGVRQAIPPTPDAGNNRYTSSSPAPSPPNDDGVTRMPSAPDPATAVTENRVIPVPGSDSISGDGTGEDDDSDLMFYLTQYRARARRTVEGHLCASAFVEKNQIYTDCTLEVAPDGTENREWCYHESQLNGKLERDWGFCAPPLNYERIRATVLGKIREKAEQGSELKRALTKHRSLLLGMERRLGVFCGAGHKGFERSLTRLEEMVQDSENALKSMRSLSNDVVEIKQEIKRDQCRYRSLQQKMPPEASGQLSDGLVGTYFSGHLLEFPAYGSRVDRELNFVFSDFMPVVGLNPHRFSAVWHGFLRAPHSGNFVFAIETSSYVRMELEGVEIVNNGLVRQGDSESGYRYSVNPMMRGATLTSQSQQLIGGRFYRVQVEFSHSQQYHPRAVEAVLKLEWSSLRLPQEVIKDYLYTRVVPPRLSISYLSHEHFAVDIASNGSLAFVDDPKAFLTDLSNDLIGTNMVRTVRSPGFRTFVMQVNTACALFVAYAHEVLPVSAVTEDALRFGESAGSFVQYVDGDGKVTPLRVKRAILQRGHTYTFNVEVRETPFILFLSLRAVNEPSQGEGPLKVVSVPDSEFYLNCSESSSVGDGFGCSAGLSGKLLDQKHAIWRPQEGAGAWLKVNFRRPVLISGFQLKQSDDPSRWVRRLSLEFGDHSEFFEILHSNDPRSNIYNLSEPRAVTDILVRVDDLYTSAQSTALGINFLGQRLVEESPGLRRIFLNCHDTLEDNVEVQPLMEGHSYELVCSRRCFDPSMTPGAVEVNDIKTPPCSALNIDLCRVGGDHGVCHAAVTILRKHNGDPASDGGFGFVLSRLDRGIRDVPFNVSIIFKSAPNRLPQQNFLVDNGSLKGPIDASYVRQVGGNPRMGEVSYGWLRPNVSDGSALGVAFPLPGESQRCIQTPGCQPNYWSIDLPRNGRFKVELVVGDASTSEASSNTDRSPTSLKSSSSTPIFQRLCVELNGEVLLGCVEVAHGSLYTLVKEVEVRNNLLKVTSTSGSASCAKYRTRLQFIKDTSTGNASDSPERPDWLVYPADSYNFREDSAPIGQGLLFKSSDSIVNKRIRAYNQNGLRVTVYGVILCHRNGFPHIVLLQDSSGSSGLLGGKCKTFENPREVLRRKVARFMSTTRKGGHQLDLRANADNVLVGEFMGEFWRQDYDSDVLPYLPLHVNRPREKILIYQVTLREHCSFVSPNELRIIPVPLHDFYSPDQGVAMSALPHLLARFNLSFMHHPESVTKDTICLSSCGLSENDASLVCNPQAETWKIRLTVDKKSGFSVADDCQDSKKRYKCVPYESTEIQCSDAAFETYPAGYSCFTQCGELRCPSDDYMTPSPTEDFKLADCKSSYRVRCRIHAHNENQLINAPDLTMELELGRRQYGVRS